MISAIRAATATTPAASLPALPQTPAATGGPDFGQVLADLVTDAAGTLRQGESAAIAGVQGQMTTQAAVEQVLAAERTLQAVIAIRDKAVGSYLEISRMQI